LQIHFSALLANTLLHINIDGHFLMHNCKVCAYPNFKALIDTVVGYIY